MNETKINFLKTYDVDLENALNYTGDYETYNEILLDFYDGVDEQLKTLESTKNDMPNYAILVHALKSNARTLGIKYLADVCYQHEMESKANNIEYVNNNFNNIIEQVNKFKEMTEKYKEIN